VLAGSPIPAEEPEDRYAQVYGLIQEAESLNTKGQIASALAKYRKAETALLGLQRDYPQWDHNVVAFRLSALAQKIAELSEKAQAPATNKPPPGIKAALTDVNAVPEVKLLDAGTEPRQVLRVHPEPGDKQTVNLTIKVAIDVKVGDTPSAAPKEPTRKLILEVRVKSVSADGDLAYESIVKDAELVDEPGVLPQVAEASKSAFAKLKGRANTATVSSRGIKKATDVQPPDAADPEIAQTAEQARELVTQGWTELPEEAVGVGARWQVNSRIKVEGLIIERSEIYQLVSLEGGLMTAEIAVTERAANQKIETRAVPGLKLNLETMTGIGRGQLKLDLAHLLPAQASLSHHTEFSMAASISGQKQAITMKRDAELQLEAK
jgi:hypothetical protein